MALTSSDVDWVRTSFMVPVRGNGAATSVQYYSSVRYKFSDTTPGGSLAINPPPQFTSTADLKSKGTAPSSRGMGRKYSEMIDDNSQVVYMRFGVPQFNSMMTFFGGMYDAYAGILSRTGREPGWFYGIGKAVGFVVSAPIQPLLLAGTFYRYLTNQPSTKYYYLKPAMPVYWNMVNSIANHIAVNMGIVPNVLTTSSNAVTNERTDSGANQTADENKGKYNIGEIVQLESNEQYTSSDIEQFHNMLPNVYRKGGGIDVYALATRAQRLANQRRKAIEQAAERSSSADETAAAITAAAKAQLSKAEFKFKPEGVGEEPGLDAYLGAWRKEGFLSKVESGNEEEYKTGESGKDVGGESGWWSRAASFFEAELDDGGQFIGLRVNHTGEASESFSNQTGESAIAGVLNGTAAKSRSFRFSTGDGEAFGSVIGSILESGRQLFEGAIEGIGLSGLGALLLGSAYADVPEEWKDSTAEMPSATYTIELRSPYGNKMSRYTNLMIPLSMLLAGVLPKSTGKFSYDSPFLCQIYDKGRTQVRLGIIDSMAITRGTGNVGWTQSHEPLGIDVTFTVKDLSSIMHMPLSNSPGILDHESAFVDYMAVLGSLSLTDQLYGMGRLRLSLTRKLTNWQSMNSPARWGLMAANSLPGEVIRAFAVGTAR